MSHCGINKLGNRISIIYSSDSIKYYERYSIVTNTSLTVAPVTLAECNASGSKGKQGSRQPHPTSDHVSTLLRKHQTAFDIACRFLMHILKGIIDNQIEPRQKVKRVKSYRLSEFLLHKAF